MNQFLIYCGVASLAAYLLGALNGALLMSRLLMGDDIRKHGSGNAGATNVLRTYGAKWTVLVSAWDVGKDRASAFQIKFKTAGYENIKLTCRQKSVLFRQK